jgi:hypothetical protein
MARTRTVTGLPAWIARCAVAERPYFEREESGFIVRDYVPIAPDAARDARVAKRRAEDARKAGAALDRLLNRWWFPDGPDDTPHTVLSDEFVEKVGDYVLSRIHHNGHYGVPTEADGGPQGCLDHLVNQLNCQMCGSIRKGYYDRMAAGVARCCDADADGTHRPGCSS